MIKTLVFLFLIASINSYAQDFSGCGEYEFKGVLRHDDHVPFKMIYIVNENTKSQMIFNLQEMEDMKKIAIMVNLPSKLMDGTKGVLTFPSEIGRRLPDPLSSKDTGITKIKNFKCD